jgi:hypothetical protein
MEGMLLKHICEIPVPFDYLPAFSKSSKFDVSILIRRGMANFMAKLLSKHKSYKLGARYRIPKFDQKFA